MPRRLLAAACLLALSGAAQADPTSDSLLIALVLETKKACDAAFPATSAKTSKAVDEQRKKQQKAYAEAEKRSDFPSMRKSAGEHLQSLPKAQLEKECLGLADGPK